MIVEWESSSVDGSCVQFNEEEKRVVRWRVEVNSSGVIWWDGIIESINTAANLDQLKLSSSNGKREAERASKVRWRDFSKWFVCREKNAKKNAKGPTSQLDTRAAALTYQCSICKVSMTSYTVLKIHMESKHPSAPMPADPKLATGWFFK